MKQGVKGKVGPLHGTAKSGYAKELMPSRMEGEEAAGLACPPASSTGRQEGRVPPIDKVYKANYETVTAEEAMRRARLRQEGAMAPIKGGLDDNRQMAQAKKASKAAESFDPFDAQSPDEDQGRLQDNQEDGPVISPELKPVRVLRQPQMPQGSGPPPAASFLAQRRRIEIELPDSTHRVSAIAVLVTRYCVTILLPLTDDGSTFVPKPGSEVSIIDNDKVLRCYFPGASFEVPELKLMGLSFIRAED